MTKLYLKLPALLLLISHLPKSLYRVEDVTALAMIEIQGYIRLFSTGCVTDKTEEVAHSWQLKYKRMI